MAVSRARAAELIRRGCVTVAGVRASKPGALVGPEAALSVDPSGSDYVSRGALKLVAALDAFGIDAEGRAQLHDRLRSHPRVTVLEATDARQLGAGQVDEPVTAIVADVSFISLTQALPASLKLAAPGAWLVALVKPQFEAGREAVGKGGIVRDLKDRERAIARVRAFAEEAAWQVVGVISSPIKGGSGNEEFLIGARHAG